MVADCVVVCKVLTFEALDVARSAVPQLRSVLFGNLARELAGRLRDANEEIRTLA